MTNEMKVKAEIKSIIDMVVERVESEYEVLYIGTDSIVETIYCLMLGGKITTAEELRDGICKLLKAKKVVIA